jgi:hypothetical protein
VADALGLPPGATVHALDQHLADGILAGEE